MDSLKLTASLSDLNDITHTSQVRRDINPFSIYNDMIMTNQLPSGLARSSETEPKNDIIEPPLQQTQQVFTTDARYARCFFVIAPKLAFANPVKPGELLFCSKLDTIIGLFTTHPLTMLAWGITPAFKGAFLQITTLALQKKLGAFSAAKAAVGTSMPTHLSLSPLDSAALGRPTTIMRNRGHVSDRGNLKAGIL
jgi:hypothetical protein